MKNQKLNIKRQNYSAKCKKLKNSRHCKDLDIECSGQNNRLKIKKFLKYMSPWILSGVEEAEGIHRALDERIRENKEFISCLGEREECDIIN
jgi:hypothetical protein